MTLTAHQLEILQHALGVDQYGRGDMRRNHFCAGGDDVPDCAELVCLGYMRTFRRTWLPYFNCTVTNLGKAAMLEQSRLSFREWLGIKARQEREA